MMIILKGRMAAKDAQIAYLKHELEAREKELKMLTEGEKGPTVAEERVLDLESKVREMEALMKGLTEELLDLKTIVMKLHAKDEERRAAVQRSIAPSIRPRNAPEPAASQNTSETGEMELIMQSDGTLKPEGRQRSGLIVASPRFGGLSSKGKKKGQIVSDDGKKKSSDLIYAVDKEENSKE